MVRKKTSRRKSIGAKYSLTKALDPKHGDVCGYCGQYNCCCHSKGLGWVLLILGVIFLLKDMDIFYWWNINWWTVLLLLGGIWMIRK